MVFPIEMFQKHFQNTTSTRQGIRNFWADVNHQYGGYWGFQIGESVTTPGQIGVFDSYYSPKKYKCKFIKTTASLTGTWHLKGRLEGYAITYKTDTVILCMWASRTNARQSYIDWLYFLLSNVQ